MPTLGLLCDPDFPQQVTQWLAEVSPDTLSEHLGQGDWAVHVVCDPVSTGRSSGKEMLQAVNNQRERAGWDFAVCLTDLPLRVDRGPVLADVDKHSAVGLISLPALGIVQPYRRARQMLVQLLDEITSATDQAREKPHTQRRRGIHSRAYGYRESQQRRNQQQSHTGAASTT